MSEHDISPTLIHSSKASMDDQHCQQLMQLNQQTKKYYNGKKIINIKDEEA
jgi:hypothetical protein